MTLPYSKAYKMDRMSDRFWQNRMWNESKISNYVRRFTPCGKVKLDWPIFGEKNWKEANIRRDEVIAEGGPWAKQIAFKKDLWQKFLFGNWRDPFTIKKTINRDLKK